MLFLAIKLLGVGTGIVIIAAIVVVALTFTGSPSACSDRNIDVSEPARVRLADKWETFEEEAAQRSATVTFDESEVTSRAVKWGDDEGIGLDNIRVYLCQDGYAEATATFTGPGPNIDILARGTLDLTGARPVIDVQDVKIGNLPGFVPLDVALDFVDDEDKTLDILSVRLTSISFGDGDVTLAGRQ